MRVTINGTTREVESGATVATIVTSFPGAPEGRGIAVALGGEVVARSEWQSKELADGDRLEVVVAVQGG